MKALVEFTIRSNIRNVTDLTVTIEAVAIPDVVTTFRINADQLSRRQVLKVSPRKHCIHKNLFTKKCDHLLSF